MPARKRPFDVTVALRLIRRAVRALPKAAMFALAEEGRCSLFEQVVACILSIRTRDEVSLIASRRVFAAAPTAAAIAGLDLPTLDRLIGDTTFHAAKAAQIRQIARRVEREHGGSLPCDESVVRSFRGVGPKCAHLALAIACGQQHISVDIHVHRVTNRWGYVRAGTPERTMAALETRLPLRYWLEINRLLVPFGKHICTGVLPRCSICPVLEMCRQVGALSATQNRPRACRHERRSPGLPSVIPSARVASRAERGILPATPGHGGGVPILPRRSLATLGMTPMTPDNRQIGPKPHVTDAGAGIHPSIQEERCQ